MADDKESWKRRREREDEAEAEELAKKKKQQQGSTGGLWGAGNASTDLTEKVDDLLRRAEPMIEQLNSLYNQFFSGAEKRPPVERRKQLDQLMLQLQTMHKPGASYLFKFNNIQAMYMTHRDRWDKVLKDIEQGKIKKRY